ncbi:hypothetical protein Q5P01_016577 [Channa striata]|uniref:Uncharacterized protein n=1 Tax=Channa striata TaxID=64152 RepID=A0AA88SI33_CHASR|nr:hypothetical protein Q5P01_016577 [Channa striata]
MTATGYGARVLYSKQHRFGPSIEETDSGEGCMLVEECEKADCEMERGDRGVAERGPGGGTSKSTGVSTEGGGHKGSFPFNGRVPEELLRECERNRQNALVGAACKATNLYRRVSTISCSSGGRCLRAKAQRVGKRCGGAKCLVCLVTLVKSSKYRHRAGVKLRCPCDVRVCDTCFTNDPESYLSEPHFSSCSVVLEFVCARCACFAVLMNKPCCAWMCSRCSADLRESGSSCSRCSAPVSHGEPRERHSLCCDTRSACDSTSGAPCCDERKIAEYSEEIRARVFEWVSSSRHVSTSDLEVPFPECPGTQVVCVCESTDHPNPKCPRCTPTAEFPGMDFGKLTMNMSDLNGDAWERTIGRVAEGLLKASLHVTIRWCGPWWKLVAVCSLMGFKQAYGNPCGDSCGEQHVDPGDRDLIELFQELKPGQLTVKDLLELECSLRRDCHGHEVVLGTSEVRLSLRALLPETCLVCRTRKEPIAQARKRQGKKGDRVGGGPVEPTDDNRKLSLYCHETV